MSKSKRSGQRDYARGYHDAREGKPDPTPGTLEIILDTLIPGPSGLPSEKYREGYKDGKKDKK